MRKACLLGTFLLSAIAALAQVDTGTIAGTVRDSQGAAVASANMTFVDSATGAFFGQLADDAAPNVLGCFLDGTWLWCRRNDFRGLPSGGRRRKQSA